MRLQTASYSIASGTLTNNVTSPFLAALKMAADAPCGLRIAATTQDVSKTILTVVQIPYRW